MCLCDRESPVGITHSIIPNLNSVLVPIDPVGLVNFHFLLLGATPARMDINEQEENIFI